MWNDPDELDQLARRLDPFDADAAADARCRAAEIRAETSMLVQLELAAFRLWGGKVH